MADFFGSQKLCATCAYWIAQRDVDFNNTWVKDCADKGRCAIPQGPNRNTERYATYCACFNYQKWPVHR